MTSAYFRRDIIEPATGDVGHLSVGATRDVFGHWYSLCGRVVSGWGRATVEDADITRVCASCHRKATRKKQTK